MPPTDAREYLGNSTLIPELASPNCALERDPKKTGVPRAVVADKPSRSEKPWSIGGVRWLIGGNKVATDLAALR